MSVSRMLWIGMSVLLAPIVAVAVVFVTSDAHGQVAADYEGTEGADTLVGTIGADRMNGLGGSDSIVGLDGDDTITGGSGTDTMVGGAGNDTIDARDGALDTVSCGPGSDRVTADPGDVVAGDCEQVDRGAGTGAGSTPAPPPAEEPSSPPAGSGSPPASEDEQPSSEDENEDGDAAPTSTPSSGGGTTIRVTSGQWECNKPLAEYGELPITVIHDAPNAGYDAIRLEGPGCTGDQNPNTIDLIVDIRGNGGDRGPGGDGIKVALGAHDMQITGRVECGARASGAHQDHVQVMNGQRIEFRNLRSGNTKTGAWTCWGAGGAFFVSAHNGTPTDVVCVGCDMMANNQGLNVGTSVRSGARSSTFRTLRANPCRFLSRAQQPVNVGNTCLRR